MGPESKKKVINFLDGSFGDQLFLDGRYYGSYFPGTPYPYCGGYRAGHMPTARTNFNKFAVLTPQGRILCFSGGRLPGGHSLIMDMAGPLRGAPSPLKPFSCQEPTHKERHHKEKIRDQNQKKNAFFNPIRYVLLLTP